MCALSTRANALTCLLAALFSLVCGESAAGGIKLVAGGGGWQLERFEGDIVVLRTTLSAAAGGRSGLFLLSCAGAQRRISIALPYAIPGGSDGPRSILIRSIGAPGPAKPPQQVDFTLEHGRMLTFLENDASSGSIVSGIAKRLQERPVALDVLMRAGPGAAAFRMVVPYVLSLTFGAHDGIALDNFILGCAPSIR